MIATARLLHASLQARAADGFRASLWVRLPTSRQISSHDIPLLIFEQKRLLVATYIGTILPIYSELPPISYSALVIDEGSFRYLKWRLRQLGIRHICGIIPERHQRRRNVSATIH